MLVCRVAKEQKISGEFPVTFHGKLNRGILEIFQVGNLIWELTGFYRKQEGLAGKMS